MTTRPGFIWSGSEWVSIGQEAVVAPVSYQTSAPSTPSTGDIWIDSNDDVPGIDTSQFLRWRKTMAGGETSVSGTDDTGLTLAYTPAYEQVYLNGVLLVRGQDYTATNGTSITGLTALAASDVVEVYGVVARVVGDVYTQAQADAKYSLQTTTGLVLITSATIGSAVASVTVSNCFSSAYDNYYVTISGGVGSATLDLAGQIGNATTGYYYSVIGTLNNSTVNAYGQANTSQWGYFGGGNTDHLHLSAKILYPYLTKNTLFGTDITSAVTNTCTNSFGYLNNANSYTSFTINAVGGTMTGGTIKVYGYK